MAGTVSTSPGKKSIRSKPSSKSGYEARLRKTWARLTLLKKELLELRLSRGRQAVEDYVFATPEGRRLRLSQAFGKKSDLIVVHHMGSRCPYCSLWADGYNGVLMHLESRAAFLVTMPDAPAAQRTLRDARGWRFKMASTAGTSFSADMGFEPTPGQFWPGFTTFHKRNDGTIERVASAEFGPGDDFCSVWHFFDLLDGGASGWEPQSKRRVRKS